MFMTRATTCVQRLDAQSREQVLTSRLEALRVPHHRHARVATHTHPRQGSQLVAKVAARTLGTLRLRGEADNELVQIAFGGQDVLRRESQSKKPLTSEPEIVARLRAELELERATILALAARAQKAESMDCLSRALQQSNINLTRQLREERAERVQLKLRLERLKAGCSVTSDVSYDPAMERRVEQIVKSEEVHAMEMQMMGLRQEIAQLRAQLSMQRA